MNPRNFPENFQHGDRTIILMNDTSNCLILNDKEFFALKVPTEHSNILLLQGSRGFLGCGYFSVETANQLDEAVAIVRGVANYEDMLSARIVEVSRKAQALGIKIGMPGDEALALLG